MLCQKCGLREATDHLLTIRLVENGEVPPPPPDLPVEFEEPRAPAHAAPNVCAECLAVAAPAREFLMTVLREREEAVAARLRGVPMGPPSPTALELTEAVMVASTAEPLDLADVKASMIALSEFLATAAGRTHANCVAVSQLLGRVDGWRRVNRNRARCQYLPEEYRETLAGFEGLDMTFADPELATDMETTPEQLLAAARELRVDDESAARS